MAGVMLVCWHLQFVTSVAFVSWIFCGPDYIISEGESLWAMAMRTLLVFREIHRGREQLNGFVASLLPPCFRTWGEQIRLEHYWALDMLWLHERSAGNCCSQNTLEVCNSSGFGEGAFNRVKEKRKGTKLPHICFLPSLLHKYEVWVVKSGGYSSTKLSVDALHDS